MRRPARLLARVLVAAAAMGGFASPALAAGPEQTRATVERQLRWAGAGAGGYVVDLDSGAELAASRPDAARVPASVQKLYTTAAALLRFGPDAQLPTTALAGAPITPDGVLRGDLYLRGGGDPTFGTVPAIKLAQAVVEQTGLAEITGRVVGDESAFDLLRGPPSSSFRTSIWVGPLSALAFDRGRVRGGFQARPALFAARAFERALARRRVRVGRSPATGAAPPWSLLAGEWRSPPMAELARRINVPSDNFAAETLLKGLGARFAGTGSTAAGAQVVRAAASELGATTAVADGSGLSRANRTTPRAVVGLLAGLADDPAFVASLPVAGRTGTLARRLRRSPARDRCRAKTGTLAGVSALAGYCTSIAGARTAFALLADGANVALTRRRQDAVATALATYASASTAVSAAGGGPSASSASSPASSSTGTPSRSAFSSLEPGDAPATR